MEMQTRRKTLDELDMELKVARQNFFFAVLSDNPSEVIEAYERNYHQAIERYDEAHDAKMSNWRLRYMNMLAFSHGIENETRK